jgi:hypothetical protein
MALKVIVTVSGGCAEIVSAPAGVEVEVRDYDIDGDTEEEFLGTDSNGDRYMSQTIPDEETQEAMAVETEWYNSLIGACSAILANYPEGDYHEGIEALRVVLDWPNAAEDSQS